MRYGFTTGSCAAAAAKAAAYMLLSGKRKTFITIETPKKIPFEAKIQPIARSEKAVSCGVQKDGGDDPDVTTSAWIVATVSYGINEGRGAISIEGGSGVGRVTRPGLDQPVGVAAINHVPRAMIAKEVQEVCDFFDYKGSLLVEISVPGGEELAKKTYNSRLGIIGGISILGTTGIVEPMSTKALLDTILVELNMARASGHKAVAVSFGNYGQAYMKQAYGYDLDESVKCSNYIGACVDMAVTSGFTHLLLVGHIGKLIKVAGGIMNTHSKEGDCRMEILAAQALLCGVDAKITRQILTRVSTTEALRDLKQCGQRGQIMQQLVDRASFYLRKRAGEKLVVECIMYENEYGELAKTVGASDLLERIKKQTEE
ncbi:MAG: cobalt-precorrin-5B (C1)-methyltransferase [Clostridiales bacterium]|nr:cobalt-precorrin-5B (C1)-methyltransferase [Clostridiales bacterium]